MIMIPKIFSVTAHTQHVGPGSTFVAIKGYKQDGIDFIAQAIEQGATKVVVDQQAQLPQETQQLITHNNIQLIRVANTRKALAQLSAQAHKYPAQKLKIIGITGTKGKTSTSFLLHHLLKTADKKTALLTTVYNKINDTLLPTQLTTQQPDYLHTFFAACVQAGIEYVVMEVAAQALTLHRVDGINFDGIIFTNLAQEHAEFYDSLDEYFAAKCLILQQRKKDASVLINGDDLWGKRILENHSEFIPFNKDMLQSRSNGFDKLTTNGFIILINKFLTFTLSLSKGRPAVSVEALREDWEPVEGFDREGKINTFTCPALVGEFNKYNISAATLMGQKLNIDDAVIQQGLDTFPGVPGRLEKYELPNGARAFIDYAHNPSSYKAVLSTMRPLTNDLIVVFGTGGQRDKTKRPLMGAVASEYADTIILTSDNPRTESAHDIVHDIIDGIPDSKREQVLIELDRERAIKKAYNLAQKDSIIMVLGKGPDEYQEIGTTKYFFSDKQVVQQLR